MIVDLHAHYPMHLEESSRISPPSGHETPGDVIREMVLTLANELANFPDGKRPAVTIENLRQGTVFVALSVLYLPFDEIDLSEPYAAPPRADYFEDLLALIDAVEKSIADRPARDAVVAHNSAELDAGLAAGKVVLIHAVEGGFHIGNNRDAIRANVRELGRRGVAYITPAHLFFRQIATNAPAIPFMSDHLYKSVFHQPHGGLKPLGKHLIEAMVEERILVDVTHMRGRAIDDTLRLLDELDSGKTVPVVASHTACKHGNADYNISDAHLRAIAERNGVAGLIACEHWLANGLQKPKTFADSLALFDKHIDHIRAATGSDDVAALGSDMDGFIKPPLPGFETPVTFPSLEQHLREKYSAAVGAKICHENATRVLRHWGDR